MGATRIFLREEKRTRMGWGRWTSGELRCADIRRRESVSHLRRSEFTPIDTQRLSAGLMSFAPPALKSRAPTARGGREKLLLTVRAISRARAGRRLGVRR